MLKCPKCHNNALIISTNKYSCSICRETVIPYEVSKWDDRWLKHAEVVASYSKDPSTKVGAVIIGPTNDVVSIGYNGLARGVKDCDSRYNCRETKYRLIVHAEINAIVFADRNRLKGATLYTWPMMPCSNCAAIIIQSGITQCVAPKFESERWADSFNLTRLQFEEAGVCLRVI